MRSMTTDKLASFSLGGTKKTAFERRKEELAAKRREQEAALAAEHARFVEEFESGPERPTKQFVRGGVQGGDVGASSSGRPAAPTGPRISAPQRRGPSAAARAAFQPDAIDGESLDAEPPKPPPSAAGRLAAAPARKGKDRGPSQMEEFMMELRREQEERDSRGERDSDVRKSDAPTSFDNQACAAPTRGGHATPPPLPPPAATAFCRVAPAMADLRPRIPTLPTCTLAT